MEAFGKCLCGAVRAKIPSISERVGACHCTMCRKWNGGPWLGVEGGAEVHWEGEDNIAVYDSSDWAQRGFCKKCGSHLFYKLKLNSTYFISIGLLDQAANYRLHHQVFIDEKPDYYNFVETEKTRNLTGAEVFARFSGK